MADKKGLSIAQVKEMDYDEFINWILYYQNKIKEHDKLDYYLAQITGYLSQKKNFKINDFLIKFSEESKTIKLDGHGMAQLFKGFFKAEDITEGK